MIWKKSKGSHKKSELRIARNLPKQENKAICYNSSSCQLHFVTQKPPTL